MINLSFQADMDAVKHELSYVEKVDSSTRDAQLDYHQRMSDIDSNVTCR